MARRKKSLLPPISGRHGESGFMMKNKEKYAVGVRKPDGEISGSGGLSGYSTRK